MVKRVLIAAAALIAIVVVAVVVLARAAFGTDTARADISQQLSRALGPTATAGSVSVSPFGPTITARDVGVGEGGAIHIDAVRISPGITALVSRRLDGADVTIAGMRVALPLQHWLTLSRGEGPLALSRVRSLTLSDFELSTHGRRLRINGELRPTGDHGWTLSRASIDGDDMHVLLSGAISDTTTWKGE